MIVIDASGVEHVAVRLDGGLLRLDVVEGTLRDGPADVSVVLDVDEHAPAKLAAIDRLLRLIGVRDPGRRCHVEDPRLPRLVEALRVMDALSQGASLKNIAEGLALADDRSVVWPGAGDHAKSAIRRKVALARRLARQSPRDVLRGTV